MTRQQLPVALCAGFKSVDAAASLASFSALSMPLKYSEKMLSEMMSTQAGHTVKRTGPKLPVEKKLEKCFLCGKPSEDQVRSAKQFFFTGIFSTWDLFQAFKH